MYMKRVCIPAAVAVLLLALFSCKDTNEQAPSETTYVYAVEHYKEQPGGIFPEASDISETLEGITGKEKSFTPQSFEGFTWDESLTEKGDTVIKLYYRRNAVTVRFNLDGGTVDTALTDGCLTGRFGEKLVISDPEKDGQDFTGWSPEVPDSFPAEAMQYTALWSLISYPVVYELNGGTNSEKNPQTYTYEDELTLSIPVRTGYVFSGWYTEPDFSGTPVIQIVRHTSGELHVYAKWTGEIYTVTYKINNQQDDAQEPYTQEMQFGTPQKLIPVRFDYFGHDFVSWSSKADGSGTLYSDQADFEIGTKNINLYARWERIEYTITYDTDGGILSSTSKTAFHASASMNVDLGKATKAGYTFRCWHDENGIEVSKINKEYLLSEQNKEKRTFHFTAVWEKK